MGQSNDEQQLQAAAIAMLGRIEVLKKMSAAELKLNLKEIAAFPEENQKYILNGFVALTYAESLSPEAIPDILQIMAKKNDDAELLVSTLTATNPNQHLERLPPSPPKLLTTFLETTTVYPEYWYVFFRVISAVIPFNLRITYLTQHAKDFCPEQYAKYAESVLGIAEISDTQLKRILSAANPLALLMSADVTNEHAFKELIDKMLKHKKALMMIDHWLENIDIATIPKNNLTLLFSIDKSMEILIQTRQADKLIEAIEIANTAEAEDLEYTSPPDSDILMLTTQFAPHNFKAILNYIDQDTLDENDKKNLFTTRTHEGKGILELALKNYTRPSVTNQAKEETTSMILEILGQIEQLNLSPEELTNLYLKDGKPAFDAIKQHTEKLIPSCLKQIARLPIKNQKQFFKNKKGALSYAITLHYYDIIPDILRATPEDQRGPLINDLKDDNYALNALIDRLPTIESWPTLRFDILDVITDEAAIIKLVSRPDLHINSIKMLESYIDGICKVRSYNIASILQYSNPLKVLMNYPVGEDKEKLAERIALVDKIFTYSSNMLDQTNMINYWLFKTPIDTISDEQWALFFRAPSEQNKHTNALLMAQNSGVPISTLLQKLDKTYEDNHEGKKAFFSGEEGAKILAALSRSKKQSPEDLSDILSYIDNLNLTPGEMSDIFKPFNIASYYGSGQQNLIILYARANPQWLPVLLATIDTLDEATKNAIFTGETRDGSALTATAQRAKEQVPALLQSIFKLNNPTKTVIFARRMKNGTSALEEIVPLINDTVLETILDQIDTLETKDLESVYSTIKCYPGIFKISTLFEEIKDLKSASVPHCLKQILRLPLQQQKDILSDQNAFSYALKYRPYAIPDLLKQIAGLPLDEQNNILGSRGILSGKHNALTFAFDNKRYAAIADVIEAMRGIKNTLVTETFRDNPGFFETFFTFPKTISTPWDVFFDLLDLHANIDERITYLVKCVKHLPPEKYVRYAESIGKLTALTFKQITQFLSLSHIPLKEMLPELVKNNRVAVIETFKNNPRFLDLFLQQHPDETQCWSAFYDAIDTLEPIEKRVDFLSQSMAVINPNHYARYIESIKKLPKLERPLLEQILGANNPLKLLMESAVLSGEALATLITSIFNSPNNLDIISDWLSKAHLDSTWEENLARFFQAKTQGQTNALSLAIFSQAQNISGLLEKFNAVISKVTERKKFFTQPHHSGYNTLMITAGYASKHFKTVIEQIKSLELTPEEKVAMLSQTSEDGWSVLMITARYAPEQLEILFEYIHPLSPEAKKTLFTQSTKDGWNALGLASHKRDGKKDQLAVVEMMLAQLDALKLAPNELEKIYLTHIEGKSAPEPLTFRTIKERTPQAIPHCLKQIARLSDDIQNKILDQKNALTYAIEHKMDDILPDILRATAKEQRSNRINDLKKNQPALSELINRAPEITDWPTLHFDLIDALTDDEKQIQCLTLAAEHFEPNAPLERYIESVAKLSGQHPERLKSLLEQSNPIALLMQRAVGEDPGAETKLIALISQIFNFDNSKAFIADWLNKANINEIDDKNWKCFFQAKNQHQSNGLYMAIFSQAQHIPALLDKLKTVIPEKTERKKFFTEPNIAGFNALMITARISPKHLNTIIEQIKSLELTQKESELMLSQTFAHGWNMNILMFTALHGPEQLGILFELINKLSAETKKTLFIQSNKNGFNALGLAADISGKKDATFVETILTQLDKLELEPGDLEKIYLTHIEGIRAPEPLTFQSIKENTPQAIPHCLKQIAQLAVATQKKILGGEDVLTYACEHHPEVIEEILAVKNPANDATALMIFKRLATGTTDADKMLLNNFKDGMMKHLTKHPELLIVISQIPDRKVRKAYLTATNDAGDNPLMIALQQSPEAVPYILHAMEHIKVQPGEARSISPGTIDLDLDLIKTILLTKNGEGLTAIQLAAKNPLVTTNPTHELKQAEIALQKSDLSAHNPTLTDISTDDLLRKSLLLESRYNANKVMLNLFRQDSVLFQFLNQVYGDHTRDLFNLLLDYKPDLLSLFFNSLSNEKKNTLFQPDENGNNLLIHALNKLKLNRVLIHCQTTKDLFIQKNNAGSTILACAIAQYNRETHYGPSLHQVLNAMIELIKSTKDKDIITEVNRYKAELISLAARDTKLSTTLRRLGWCIEPVVVADQKQASVPSLESSSPAAQQPPPSDKTVAVIVSPSAPNELHNMCNVISGVVARHEAIQGSKLRTLDCRASLATTDGETMTEADKTNSATAKPTPEDTLIDELLKRKPTTSGIAELFETKTDSGNLLMYIVQHDPKSFSEACEQLNQLATEKKKEILTAKHEQENILTLAAQHTRPDVMTPLVKYLSDKNLLKSLVQDKGSFQSVVGLGPILTFFSKKTPEEKKKIFGEQPQNKLCMLGLAEVHLDAFWETLNKKQPKAIEKENKFKPHSDTFFHTTQTQRVDYAYEKLKNDFGSALSTYKASSRDSNAIQALTRDLNTLYENKYLSLSLDDSKYKTVYENVYNKLGIFHRMWASIVRFCCGPKETDLSETSKIQKDILDAFKSLKTKSSTTILDTTPTTTPTPPPA